MAHRVEILELVMIPMGRGYVEYKAGWKGPVKAEAFEKLMKTGKAKDITPASKSKSDSPAKSEEDAGGRAS